MKAPEPLPAFELSAEEMEQAEQASKYINDQAEQAAKGMARLAADLFKEGAKHMKYIVYMHISPSGKRYIGITGLKLKRRVGKDGSGYKSCTAFYNAIKKYGWDNIQSKIIYAGLSQDEAVQKEKELIAMYDTTNPKKGYNISTGGESGNAGTHHITSEETKEKLRKWNLANPNRYWLGKTMPQSVREKMSKSHIGSKRTEATKEKMRTARAKQLPPRGIAVFCSETGQTFTNAVEASKSTGCDSSSIRRVCKGEYSHTRGFHFSFVEGGLLYEVPRNY